MSKGNYRYFYAIDKGNPVRVYIDSEDYNLVTQWQWQVMTGPSGNKYVRRTEYIQTKNKQQIFRTQLLHRLVLDTTKNPRNMHTDHIDHNGLNNRKSNLRTCTPSENLRHQKKAHTHKGKKTASIYKGVTHQREYWVARIGVSGKYMYLGNFKNEIDAALAYDTAALKYFKEFAITNF